MFSTDEFSTQRSWTDDLEDKKYSGKGYVPNLMYRNNGNWQQLYEYQDRCFYYKFDDDNYLYGLFDGHLGVQATEYCSEHISEEILLGQLNENLTEEEIKEVLRQAFLTIEKRYMQQCDPIFAKKTELSDTMCDRNTITKLNRQLSAGTAAAVVLIYNKKLFVANVGKCRVLLGKTDANNVLKVVQLSVDHDLQNEDEILRISQFGLSQSMLRAQIMVGNQYNTRCLGNFMVKGGYKEFPILEEASQSPVIAEPDVHGGIDVDDSFQFLLLLSSGLTKAVSEVARHDDNINMSIAQSVHEQFRTQLTLADVAQAVVNNIVDKHKKWYMQSAAEMPQKLREDVTLLLRNFSYPMTNLRNSSASLVTFNPVIQTQSINESYNSNESNTNTDISRNTLSNTQTTSSSEPDSEKTAVVQKKIEPYVDFSIFYENIEKAKRNGTLPDGIDI